jgi:H+/Cl- antiporter ClcA
LKQSKAFRLARLMTLTSEDSGTIEQPSQTISTDETQVGRDLTYAQIIFWAAVIGVAGGLVATAYYYLLKNSMHLVWQQIPAMLQAQFPGEFLIHNYVWIAASVGGLLVGLSLYFLGLPGEVAFVVDKVHDPGRIDIQQTPAMIVASLFSIVAGGSAGPEAPLVQINGSIGGWLGGKLKVSLPTVRILTFCGMSAALGAFFGAPLGGALFALEIPHRRGLEYYEAIVPAVLSAILSFTVFRSLTGLSIGGMYHFASIPPMTLMNLLEGAILGIVGAAVAFLFVLVFRVVGYLTEPLHHHTIALATLGGLAIGLIALVFPQTLFFGEEQIDTIIEQGATYGISLLLMISLAKMLAISCTLHSGFRGGFIFPLFYIGSAIGLAISLGFPQVHPTIAMVCLMAAVNVAITKTPVSTTVILSVIADTSMVPVIVIASFTSFLLTTQVSLIKTQRSRSVPRGESQTEKRVMGLEPTTFSLGS